MTKFEFTGKWEDIPYNFTAFKGLKNDGSVKLFIHDELSEEIEPRKEQLDTINWISDNPDSIKAGLLKGLQAYYPKVKEIYGYNPEDRDDQLNFPLLETVDDLNKIIGIGNVFISLILKEGFATYNLDCRCNWDEEHGLGIIMHKDKVLDIGGADIALEGSTEVLYLKSSYEEFKLERRKYWQDRLALQKSDPSHPSLQSKNVLYLPHPVYKTFKPNQILANKRYPGEALKNEKLKELKMHIVAGRLKLEPSYLYTAISLGYTEAILYFSREIKNTPSKLMRYANSIKGVKVMLELGYDINEKDNKGWTILDRIDNRMTKFNYSKEHLKSFDDFIEWLKKNGAKISDDL